MRLCHRCGEKHQHRKTGVCSTCGCNTLLWVGVDSKPALQHARHTVFRRLSINPRYAVEASEDNIALQVFDAAFASFATSQGESLYDSDPEEDHGERCKKRTFKLTSFEEVARFASFDELRQGSGPLPRAAQAAKVLESGELAVLVPPLQLEWRLTPKQTPVVTVKFSWAVVTATGSVGCVWATLSFQFYCSITAVTL